MDRLQDIKERNAQDDRGRFPSWQDVEWLTGEIERYEALVTEAAALITAEFGRSTHLAANEWLRDAGYPYNEHALVDDEWVATG